ncbi:SGNH/GDSL hydrolase family protein [Croceibacterium aestuarii]|uniref:SGNH/GDSL hydrolase family protein n=1 Tax=Croceibacterium aestuarii TaxID=3064139 RepID=UPI00272E7F36|nr:SGNH/GDSL hydrolase family protein [Croceibacterium sp. D39]
MADRVINLVGRGLRGESYADILRRTGLFGVLPTDDDATALGKLNADADAARLAAELARDQAADLVLPENIFVDTTVAAARATAEAAVADGTTFKAVGSTEGLAEVRQMGAVSSSLLYTEVTASALASPTGAEKIGTPDGTAQVSLDAKLERATTLAGMKATRSALDQVLYGGALWQYETGDFTGLSNDHSIAKADDAALTAGARVRVPLASGNLSPSRARQLVMSQMFRMNDHANGVVLLGDSISVGAHCAGVGGTDTGNAYTNAYSWLLARAINAAFDSHSPGYHPMEHIYHPVIPSKQLHDVTFSSGDWGAVSADPAPYDYPTGKIGTNASEVCCGKSYVSSSASGATITIVVPPIAESLRLKVRLQPGGGSMVPTVNGTVVDPTVNGTFFIGTIVTDTDTYNFGAGIASGSTHDNIDVVIPIEDNGKGVCTIVLTKTADTDPFEIASLVGFTEADTAPTDLSRRMRLSNLSYSGRALSDMSEANIIYCCDAACLIVSLGVNDWFSYLTDSDDVAFAAFAQRIDWLVKYARLYGCLLVVQDFIWTETLESSRTRRELARLARQAGGIYIPYGDQFYGTGAPPADGTTLNATHLIWADALHPYADGHELIFATLATALGLPVTSKRQALMYHDWAFPLEINSGADFENLTPSAIRTISTIRQVGESYELRLNLAYTGGSPGDPMPSATLFDVIDALPERFRGAQLNLMPVRFPGSINYATGAVNCAVLLNAADAADNVKVYANDTIATNIQAVQMLRRDAV